MRERREKKERMRDRKKLQSEIRCYLQNRQGKNVFYSWDHLSFQVEFLKID
jgi:hypothetical protein